MDIFKSLLPCGVLQLLFASSITIRATLVEILYQHTAPSIIPYKILIPSAIDVFSPKTGVT